MYLKNRPNKLPPDRNFAYFCSLCCAGGSFFCYYNEINLVWFLLALAILFLFIAVFKPILLRPANMGWHFIGATLGRIISPCVMFFIYFVIFTPFALLLRAFNRDVLRIRDKERSTFVNKDNSQQTISSFKRQF